MQIQWIDCKTAKYIEMLPEVRKFLIYLNKWHFRLYIRENRLEIEDFSESCFKYILQEYYGITCIEDVDIETASDYLIPVDIFYMPYCTRYYQQEHMLHYVIVQYKEGTYVRIFDDNPAYNDCLPFSSLKKAYEETFILVKQKLPVEKYNKAPIRTLSLRDEIKIFCSQIANTSQDMTLFLQNMFTMDDLDIRARLIADFSMISKKYYAIACAMLDLYQYMKIEEIMYYADTCIDYLKRWELIFSLNTKWMILKKESYMKKIESLLPDVMPLHTLMDNLISGCKVILENYIEKG